MLSSVHLSAPFRITIHEYTLAKWTNAKLLYVFWMIQRSESEKVYLKSFKGAYERWNCLTDANPQHWTTPNRLYPILINILICNYKPMPTMSYLLPAIADNSTCFNTVIPYASDPQSTMNFTYDHNDRLTCVDDSQR